MKRNRFSLDVLADDKRVEKKDKTINEPVQFYTSKARQPYEIVVNTVSKGAMAEDLDVTARRLRAALGNVLADLAALGLSPSEAREHVMHRAPRAMRSK